MNGLAVYVRRLQTAERIDKENAINYATVNQCMRIADYRPQTADCRPQTADCRPQTATSFPGSSLFLPRESTLVPAGHVSARFLQIPEI